MASFALEVTRLAFAGLSRVSPRLSGRVAFRLFCRTPSRRPKGEKAIRTFKAGAERLRAAERLSVDVAGGTVTAYRLAASGPTVMLVHGWGSRAEYVSELAVHLNALGLTVVLVDLPGHGRSYGRALDVRMAAEALSAVEARFGPFDAAIGHSFGGLSLMAAAGGLFGGIPAVTAPRLVLIAAPSEVDEVFRDFSKLLRLAPTASRAMIAHVERETGRMVGDFDMGAVAARIGRPILVVHAEDDKEVGPYHARRYERAGDKISFYWANGYGHRRIVSAPPVFDAVAGFLLPAGAAKIRAGAHDGRP